MSEDTDPEPFQDYVDGEDIADRPPKRKSKRKKRKSRKSAVDHEDTEELADVPADLPAEANEDQEPDPDAIASNADGGKKKKKKKKKKRASIQEDDDVVAEEDTPPAAHRISGRKSGRKSSKLAEEEAKQEEEQDIENDMDLIKKQESDVVSVTEGITERDDDVPFSQALTTRESHVSRGSSTRSSNKGGFCADWNMAKTMFFISEFIEVFAAISTFFSLIYVTFTADGFPATVYAWVTGEENQKEFYGYVARLYFGFTLPILLAAPSWERMQIVREKGWENIDHERVFPLSSVIGYPLYESLKVKEGPMVLHSSSSGGGGDGDLAGAFYIAMCICVCLVILFFVLNVVCTLIATAVLGVITITTLLFSARWYSEEDIHLDNGAGVVSLAPYWVQATHWAEQADLGSLFIIADDVFGNAVGIATIVLLPESGYAQTVAILLLVYEAIQLLIDIVLFRRRVYPITRDGTLILSGWASDNFLRRRIENHWGDVVLTLSRGDSDKIRTRALELADVVRDVKGAYPGWAALDGNRVGQNTGVTLAVRFASGSVGEIVETKKNSFFINVMGVSVSTDGCQVVPEVTGGYTVGKAKQLVMF